MAITFEKALGLHDDALVLRARRSEVIANNLVNADTPGYLARDIDFREVMQEIDPRDGATLKMQTTHAGHIDMTPTAQTAELKYRNPYMPSEDGNTVSAEGEYMRFAENNVRYQATLRFLGSRFQGLRNAIKGE